MTPAARVEAAINILDSIEASLKNKGLPADALLRGYFKSRRYIGSKDRAAITDLVYTVLRRRGLLAWCTQALGLNTDGRSMMLAHAALNAPQLMEMFGAGGYGPKGLSDQERSALTKIAELGEPPKAAACNLPNDILSSFINRFGKEYEKHVEALGRQAPLDLRVNMTNAKRAEVVTQLRREGFDAQPTPYSPWGIRLKDKPQLSQHELVKSGAVEVQDEAAQVAALLSGARPGMTVVDLCAGAGGKTLAMAALMGGAGRIIACDPDQGRLAGLRRRVGRAGHDNIEIISLPDNAALSGLKGQADLVFLDVPCSGSGTWRRNPDLRWRYDAAAILKFTQLQDQLLDQGFGLLKPGGRLVYATCSLWLDENETRIEAALTRHKDLKLHNYRDFWPREGDQTCPESDAKVNNSLLLSPLSHDCDGFFVAILGRVPDPKAVDGSH